ncbi:MAG: chromosomal replication initiator protein DnaA [Coriobacteriia bacterium]|nr:chromosomal replication initiator protein DnaA [Coriobacteriia bacterium]
MATTDITAIWNDVLAIVRAELNTPSFKTWFEHTAPVELTDDGVFVVGVQNDFARAWLEERYAQRLSAALRQVVGTDMTVRIVVDRSAQTLAEVAESEAVAAEQEVQDGSSTADATFTANPTPISDFDPKYTFDSFVSGESNRFARNAAQAVAEAPGLKYNPLFIWGGPGLGKTHLLQAIGHYVTQNYPHKKVIYVTSEQFTNDYIDSIRAKRIDGFRQKYRSVDVLLIDDIQFLETKEGIQEQFFNTFNELQRRGKAIVLASDRPPKDINMEERYQSRFAMGLLADVQPPDVEMRLAILREFAEAENIRVHDDVLEFLANIATPNIREMEGAMIRIGAWRDLSKRPVVDLETAREVLKDFFPERCTRPVSLSAIQREVCRYYSMSHADLIGSKRSQAIVYPRQIAMYLSRELTDLSLPKIGEGFGGRDHTTVMHATAKIQKLMGEQRQVYTEIQQLTNAVKQRSST